MRGGLPKLSVNLYGIAAKERARTQMGARSIRIRARRLVAGGMSGCSLLRRGRLRYRSLARRRCRGRHRLLRTRSQTKHESHSKQKDRYFHM